MIAQESTKGIQKRGSSFLVDVSQQGIRKRITCSSIEEAISVRDALKIAKRHLVAEAQGWTLQEGFDKCASAVWQGKGGEDASLRNGKAAVAFFGAHTPLDEITTDWLDAYIARLKQLGNSHATVNRKLAAISKIMSYAHQRSKMKTRPHFERQRESQGRIRFLSNEEEGQVLAYLGQWGKDDHAEAVCVLVDTGLRGSELWRISKRDIDFEQGVISIWQTKNGTPRTVPMTTRVKEIMARRAEITPIGVLFPHDNFWIAHAWQRVKCQMGLDADEQFVPYALRHTCCSRLVQRGVHLRVVQEWMGHKTLQVTMRYAHLSPTNLMEAVKVLEAC